MSRLSFFGLTILAAVSTSRLFAAEAAGIGILKDGKHIAGFTITYDGESDAELWMRLKEQSLTFERDFEIPVDEDTPHQVTLKGKVEIRVERRNDPQSRAFVDELKLVEKRAGEWYVTDEEIERTLTAAGLKKPAPRGPGAKPGTPNLLLGGPIVLGILIILVGVALSRTRDSSESRE